MALKRQNRNASGRLGEATASVADEEPVVVASETGWLDAFSHSGAEGRDYRKIGME